MATYLISPISSGVLEGSWVAIDCARIRVITDMMRNDHTHLDKGHHICNPISVKRPEDFSGKCVFTAKQLISICKSELHKAVFRMPR